MSIWKIKKEANLKHHAINNLNKILISCKRYSGLCHHLKTLRIYQLFVSVSGFWHFNPEFGTSSDPLNTTWVNESPVQDITKPETNTSWSVTYGIRFGIKIKDLDPEVIVDHPRCNVTFGWYNQDHPSWRSVTIQHEW